MVNATLRLRILHICYDEEPLLVRGKLLRTQGYSVQSVFGNEAAKFLLGSTTMYDLFIVGHAAPKEVRLEMAHWLRANYPTIRIVALNPPQCERLDELRYNAPYDEPDLWLPLVEAAVGGQS
ncbi:MAG TPA: hypothetical protein VMF64_14005 [Steroidobacteraceae bacterium]|nr:hypothetical protein [Steroidobacteraceae bacterium]